MDANLTMEEAQRRLAAERAETERRAADVEKEAAAVAAKRKVEEAKQTELNAIADLDRTLRERKAAYGLVDAPAKPAVPDVDKQKRLSRRDLTHRSYHDKSLVAFACAVGCTHDHKPFDGDVSAALTARHILRPTHIGSRKIKRFGTEGSIFVGRFQQRLCLGGSWAPYYLCLFSRYPADIGILTRTPGALNESELDAEALFLAQQKDTYTLTPFGLRLKNYGTVEEIIKVGELLIAIYPEEPPLLTEILGRNPVRWSKAEAVRAAMSVEHVAGSARIARNEILGMNGCKPNPHFVNSLPGGAPELPRPIGRGNGSITHVQRISMPISHARRSVDVLED